MSLRGIRFSRMLILLFALAAVLPMALSTPRLVVALHDEIISGAAQQLQAELAAIAERINGNFQDAIGGFSQLSRTDDVVMAGSNRFFGALAERQFVGFIADRPFVERLHILTPDGEVLATSAPKRKLAVDPAVLSEASEKEVLKVVEGRRLLLAIRVPRISAESAATESPMLFHQASQGILVAEISLEKLLFHRLDELRRQDSRLLIRRKTHVVAALPSSRFVEPRRTFAQTRTINPFPEFEFELELAEDADLKLSRANTIVIESGILALLFVFLGVAVGALTSRRLARPIEDLAGIASRYARGDYAAQPQKSSFLEIATLSHAFAEMVARIRGQIHELNATIANMHGLAAEGRTLAGMVHLGRLQAQVRMSIASILRNACPPSQGDVVQQLKVDIFYAERCFLNDGVAPGFYAVDEAGTIRPEPPAEFADLSGRYGVLLPVCDPRTFEVLAAVGVDFPDDDVLARLVPAIEALLISVSSAITTVRLEMAYRLLREKTQKIRAIFSRVNIGILLLNEELRIEPEHSDHLGRLFGEAQFGGWFIGELLERKTDLAAGAVHETVQRLVACMGESSFTVELNEPSFPRSFCTRNAREKRYIEVDWIPVFNRAERVEHFMVVFHDATEFRTLQEESRLQRREMEILFQIGARTEDDFRRFMTSARSSLAQCKLALIGEVVDGASLAHVRRMLHTLKGNASSLGYSLVANAIHALERRIPRAGVPVPQSEISLLVPVLRQQITEIEGILQEFATVCRSRLSSFFARDLAAGEPPTRGGPLLDDVFSEFSHRLDSIARAAERPAPVLSSAPARGWRIDPELADVLLSCLTHLARNSMVHGLRGLADGGQITIQVEQCDALMQLSYADSGVGLDLVALHAAGRKAGILQQLATDEEIAQMIFVAGISTARELTELAGQGVGMDAVLSLIRGVRGDVRLEFAGERTFDGHRRFRVNLVFPSDLVSRAD